MEAPEVWTKELESANRHGKTLKNRLSCFVPPVPPEKDLHMPWVSRFSVDIATSSHLLRPGVAGSSATPQASNISGL